MKTPLSYIELGKQNLLHNIAQFRQLLSPETKISCVVKANAYGHGQEEVVKILNLATDYFCVDDFLEFREIKKISKKPIIVIGFISESDLAEAMVKSATFVLYDRERVPKIERLARKLGTKAHVHIKIDAQLGRQGILLSELPEFIACLKKTKAIVVDSIYAHFANIEDTNDFSHAQKQINEYQAALEMFRKSGFKNFQTHISSSSGILAYEQSKGINSLVRLGIAVYGLWPSEDLRQRYETKSFKLKPVMRWVSHVAQLKTLPKGHTIGYGLTYVTSKKTKIAVIPQGYSDGYDRHLSNIGEVLIRGVRCRVLGRVSMNLFTADVSHLKNIKQEDEVVLLGNQGKEQISAEEIAAKLSTINYEVVARISPKLPRIIV